jgi:rubrerythrin
MDLSAGSKETDGMENFETTEQALDFAIEREKDAQAFYLEWAEKATDPEMTRVFLEFAEQECQHRETLERVRKGGKVFQFKEGLFPSMHLKDFALDACMGPDMTLEDALAVAMKREKASYRTYLELAAATEAGALVDTFLSLAHEEANHRVRLEIEYDVVIAESSV